MPRPLEYLFKAYRRLRRRKASNGFSVPPIEWPDIDAFCRHARVTLLPWELEIIEAIDDLFVAERNTQRPPPG